MSVVLLSALFLPVAACGGATGTTGMTEPRPQGFEAEISFERGKGTTGTYRLRQGPCGDQVTIKLLYEADRYRRLS